MNIGKVHNNKNKKNFLKFLYKLKIPNGKNEKRIKPKDCKKIRTNIIPAGNGFPGVFIIWGTNGKFKSPGTLKEKTKKIC